MSLALIILAVGAVGAPQPAGEDGPLGPGHRAVHRGDELDRAGELLPREAPAVGGLAGGEPYEVTAKTLVNRLDIPAFQPGVRLAVVVDPEDRTRVAVA